MHCPTRGAPPGRDRGGAKVAASRSAPAYHKTPRASRLAALAEVVVLGPETRFPRALEFPVWRLSEPLGAVVGDHEVVFNAHSAEAVDIDARLVGDDHAFREGVMLVVIRIMGHQTEAVSQSVREVVAEALVVD